MKRLSLTCLTSLFLFNFCPLAMSSTFITVNLGTLTDSSGANLNSGLVFLVSSGVDGVFSSPVIGSSNIVGGELVLKAWEYTSSLETPGFFTNTYDLKYVTDLVSPGPGVANQKLAAYFFKGLTSSSVNMLTGDLTGGLTIASSGPLSAKKEWNLFTSLNVENFGDPAAVPDASAWVIPADTGATITVSGATTAIGGSSLDSALQTSNSFYAVIPEPNVSSLLIFSMLMGLRKRYYRRGA